MIGKRKEILLSEVFNQRNIAPRIVVEDLWDIEAVFLQEVGYRKEKAIIFTFEGIMYPDERGMVLCFEPNDGSSRSAPFDRLKDNSVVRLKLEVGTNGGK